MSFWLFAIHGKKSINLCSFLIHLTEIDSFRLYCLRKRHLFSKISSNPDSSDSHQNIFWSRKIIQNLKSLCKETQFKTPPGNRTRETQSHPQDSTTRSLQQIHFLLAYYSTRISGLLVAGMDIARSWLAVPGFHPLLQVSLSSGCPNIAGISASHLIFPGMHITPTQGDSFLPDKCTGGVYKGDQDGTRKKEPKEKDMKEKHGNYLHAWGQVVLEQPQP